MMFGMMGQFLPAGAATIVASNPVLLGAGALFGGLQMFEDRKRKVAAAAPAGARSRSVSSWTTCSSRSSNKMTQLLRDLQRDLRDEFGERLAELQRTYADTAQHAPEDREPDAGAVEAAVSGDRAAGAVLTKWLRRSARAERRTEPRGVMALPMAHRRARSCRCIDQATLPHKLDGTPHRADIDAIRARLDGPLRVAIAGRVKAGQVDVAQRARRRAAGRHRRRRVHAARDLVPATARATRSRPGCATGRSKALAFRRDDGALHVDARRHDRERRRAPRRHAGRRSRCERVTLIDTPGLASLERRELACAPVSSSITTATTRQRRRRRDLPDAPPAPQRRRVPRRVHGPYRGGARRRSTPWRCCREPTRSARAAWTRWRRRPASPSATRAIRPSGRCAPRRADGRAPCRDRADAARGRGHRAAGAGGDPARASST